MKLSPRTTKKIQPGTSVVETGLVKDRWKGYKAAPDHPGYNPTGADARASLVGAYAKRKKKRAGAHERAESKAHERGEMGEDD